MKPWNYFNEICQVATITIEKGGADSTIILIHYMFIILKVMKTRQIFNKKNAPNNVLCMIVYHEQFVSVVSLHQVTASDLRLT